MTDREHVERWVADYVAAWKSYDRDEIGALFAENAEVRYHPWDEPIAGRDAIVESWFGAGEGAPGKDEQGTYEGSYTPVAIDGDLAVVTGTSTYAKEPGGPVDQTFHNCFLIRFDADGRCSEFAEWYMEPRE
jgi:ketosteroid isomerase-like protein